jgi:hypothetical protein
LRGRRKALEGPITEEMVKAFSLDRGGWSSGRAQ